MPDDDLAGSPVPESGQEPQPAPMAARRSVLLGHIANDLAEAREVRGCLAHDSVPAPLRSAAALQLRQRVEQVERDLAALADYARTGDIKAVDWRSLLRMRLRLRRLIRESLALLASAFLRNAKLDHEVSTTTDGAIGLLARWCGLDWQGAVLHGDAYVHDRTADLIRMRFPVYSIADFPLALHELGHKVVVELRHRDAEAGEGAPLRRLADEQPRGLLPEDFGRGRTEADLRAVAVVHARELLADAFATYATGRAYAYCLLSLVTPDNLTITTPSHPSWTYRLYFVRQLLLLLDAGDGAATVSTAITTWIAPVWESLAWEVGGEPPATGSIEALDVLAEAALHDLTRNTDPRLRYRHDMAKVATIADHLSDPTPALTRADDWALRQIVNAVWHWRLRHPGDTPLRRSVDRRAAVLARRSVTGRAND